MKTLVKQVLLYISIVAFVGTVSISCVKTDENQKTLSTEATTTMQPVVREEPSMVASLSDRLPSNTSISDYVRSPYLKHYQHIHETSGKDCSAIAYTLAFNMVQDYVNPNNTFPCTAQNAATIFQKMKRRFNTDKPNVGQLETYFWENEYKTYGRNSAIETRSFSTANELKDYILNNLEYNVIVLPVAINVSKFSQGVRGDLTIGKAEDQYYITNTHPSGRYPNYGHFIVILAKYKSNGKDVIGYLDCLAPHGRTIEMRYCTLDRLCQSNQATSSYTPKKYAVLRMQHR